MTKVSLKIVLIKSNGPNSTTPVLPSISLSISLFSLFLGRLLLLHNVAWKLHNLTNSDHLLRRQMTDFNQIKLQT